MARQNDVDDVDSMISGGGRTPTFPFAEIGDTVTGIILSRERVQKREYKPSGGIGDLMFWEDGSPRYQIKVVLQTDLTDWEGTPDTFEPPDDEDDDGIRAVYLEFKKLDAVREALKAAGKDVKLREGGKLRLRFSAEQKNRGAYPTKLFEARYKPPVDDIDADLDEDTPPARGRKGKAAKADDEDEAPRRQRRRASAATEDEADEAPAPRRGRAKPKRATDTDDEPGF